MTKEEILSLVNEKIAGQGTAVDAGGALAPILSAIVDLLPSETIEADIAGLKKKAEFIEMQLPSPDTYSLSDFLAQTGITETVLQELISGQHAGIQDTSESRILAFVANEIPSNTGYFARPGYAGQYKIQFYEGQVIVDVIS